MAVNKSEAAILLGITKSRISQLVARGLPVDASGLIDVDAARNWIEQNTDHARRAGWHEARGLTKPIAPPSPHSGRRRQAPTPPDAYAPAAAFPRPGERGFALAAARTLHLLPLATVSAVAEVGGTAELAAKVADLTPQQYKVLFYLTEGWLNKQIAYDLHISEATVKAHITAIFRKLGVTNRTQVVIQAQRLQLEPPADKLLNAQF